jgi:hypothetical protein
VGGTAEITEGWTSMLVVEDHAEQVIMGDFLVHWAVSCASAWFLELTPFHAETKYISAHLIVICLLKAWRSI